MNRVFTFSLAALMLATPLHAQSTDWKPSGMFAKDKTAGEVIAQLKRTDCIIQFTNVIDHHTGEVQAVVKDQPVVLGFGRMVLTDLVDSDGGEKRNTVLHLNEGRTSKITDLDMLSMTITETWSVYDNYTVVQDYVSEFRTEDKGSDRSVVGTLTCDKA